jgi:hypothetical protein
MASGQVQGQGQWSVVSGQWLGSGSGFRRAMTSLRSTVLALLEARPMSERKGWPFAFWWTTHLV